MRRDLWLRALALSRRALVPAVWLLAAALAGACGSAPPPVEEAPSPPPPRAAALPDDCAIVDGKAPEPLVRAYEGLAAKARCQREVYTIMGGVTHFLGVKCEYCHEVPDYPKMTHRKHVANWMARELVPRLKMKEGGAAPWCGDCHRQGDEGVAKLLGDPRDPRRAAEWMTVHLVGRFEEATGDPLRCKVCHGANPGSPEFRRKVLLTDSLPPRP